MLRPIMIGLVVTVLAGCDAGAPAPPPPATTHVTEPAPTPTRRATLADLVAAAGQRVQADGTSEAKVHVYLSESGQPVRATNSTVSVVQHGTGPASVRYVTQSPEITSGFPLITELVVTPDDAFVRQDRQVWPEPKPPWVRIDPAGRDQLSAHFTAFVSYLRTDRSGIGCLTETGTAAIQDATPTRLDGVAVLRYALRTRLDDTATDLATSQELRRRGLTSVDSAVYVDGADRPLRCEADVEFPGGGSYVTEQRLVGFGQPLTIDAPPADQVQRLPA